MVSLLKLYTCTVCISCCVCSVLVDVKKVEDGRKAKEMGQLRKEARKRDHQIKSLQSDARRREAVLKRRQEEVCSQ